MTQRTNYHDVQKDEPTRFKYSLQNLLALNTKNKLSINIFGQ